MSKQPALMPVQTAKSAKQTYLLLIEILFEAIKSLKNNEIHTHSICLIIV